jgi:hypothetical protein
VASNSDGGDVLVWLGKCDSRSAERVSWVKAGSDQGVWRIIQVSVVERRKHARNIHLLARETRNALAKCPHGVAENLLEFFDPPIALIHRPILRLFAVCI